MSSLIDIWLVNDYLWLMVDDYLWLMVRKYLSGWWLTYPSEKYDFVNGKDDNPYMKWKIKNVPNHQPVIIVVVVVGKVIDGPGTISSTHNYLR